jgi:hypothetical protein
MLISYPVKAHNRAVDLALTLGDPEYAESCLVDWHKTVRWQPCPAQTPFPSPQGENPKGEGGVSYDSQRDG